MKISLIYNTIYQLITILIPLLTTPYLSRVLGSESIGIYSYGYSIACYFSIFILLGLNTYGIREIAKLDKNDKSAISKKFWSIYFMQLTFGVLIFILYILYAILMAKNETISIIFSIYILSTVLDINWFYFGLEKFKFTILRSIVIKVFFTSLIFLLVRSSKDIYLYSFIMASSFLASQIPLWIFLRREVKFFKPSISDVITHIKPNMLLFLSVLGVSLYKYMDKIILGILSTMTQVGIYEQAEKIVNLPTVLIVSLGTVMLPRMTNLYSRNIENAEKYFEKSIYFSILTSSVLCLGIISVGKIFVPIFYGQGYEQINTLYLYLLPSCIFLGIGNVITTQYLIPKGKDLVYIKSIFLGAIVNLLINLILVKQYASVGVAIGTLLAEVCVCLYKIYACQKEINVYKCILNSWPALCASLGMLFFMRNLDIYNIISVFNLIKNIFIGALIFLVLFTLFNLIQYGFYKMKKGEKK